MPDTWKNQKLDIWGKAQRESTQCRKSDWGANSGGCNSRDSKVTWPELECISVRRMRTVDLGWVNVSRIISGVSGTKFTKFFGLMQQEL